MISTRALTKAAARVSFLTPLQRHFVSARRVGFVGLGRMGLPMARNLARTTDVIVYDPSPVACDEALASGMKVVESAQAVGASDCEVLFAMLPGCQAFDSVMEEWKDCVRENQTIVNCSTVSPSTSKKWEAAYRAKGHTVFDSPVSGGVTGAGDGTLTFMVGCESEDELAKVKPFLDLMGKRAIYCGKAGAGSATKLCNNLALATQMIGICEALRLGEAVGVDPAILSSVMGTSTAKCWSVDINNPHPVVAANMPNLPPASRDYEGGFATNLMLKDLNLALQSAQEEKVALPLTSAAKNLYHLAQLQNLGELDFGVILAFLRG
jgi:3-hydroxyisobutyrate dehydrogenase